jgi:hypothetical protein
MYYDDSTPESLAFQKWDSWSKWILFLLVGLSLTGRSFAYLGIPPAKLFIGDLTLAAFIALHPRKIFDPWIKALTRGGPFGPIAWLLLGSLAYGIFEVIRGILLGFSPLVATENLVFNIYPLYLFLGIWLGRRHPQLLLRFFQVYSICFCVYAPAYMLFLNQLTVMMPGAEGVPIFGQPSGGGIIILALLCLDRKPSRFWAPMAIAVAMLLAGQVRAEWAGMLLALLVWGILSKKMANVAMIGAGIAILLAIGSMLDINVPAPEARGGNISSREIVARGLAAIDPALAKDVTGSAHVALYNGTITWRETWWRAIWANSQANYTNLLIGPGYGFLLRNLVNYLKDLGDLRTPHNIFYYALGYCGWFGVLFFFSLQAACGALVWRVYKMTGQSFGVVFWASTLFTSFFGNAFETPTGAIPCYLTLGLIIGPTLSMFRSQMGLTLANAQLAIPQEESWEDVVPPVRIVRIRHDYPRIAERFCSIYWCVADIESNSATVGGNANEAQ